MASAVATRHALSWNFIVPFYYLTGQVIEEGRTFRELERNFVVLCGRSYFRQRVKQLILYSFINRITSGQ